jgi:hypothetical protein
MNLDLLFNTDPEHEIVSEAIIALEEPTLVNWPLDEINDILAGAYQASMDIPHLTYDGRRYTIESTAGSGEVDYITPFGPDLPCEAINIAIASLMGQELWPDDWAIYLYPVHHKEVVELSGLWLANTQDFLGMDPDLDEVVFRMVRDASESKHGRKKFPSFHSRRMSF